MNPKASENPLKLTRAYFVKILLVTVVVVVNPLFDPFVGAVDQLPLFETKIVCRIKGTKTLKKTVGVKGDGKKETARLSTMSLSPTGSSSFSIYINGTKGGGTLSTVFTLNGTMGGTPDYSTMINGKYFDFTVINPVLHISKDRFTFPITYPIVDNDVITDANNGSSATGMMKIKDIGYDADDKLLATGILVVNIANVTAIRNIQHNSSSQTKTQRKTLPKVRARCSFKNLYLKE